MLLLVDQKRFVDVVADSDFHHLYYLLQIKSLMLWIIIAQIVVILWWVKERRTRK